MENKTIPDGWVAGWMDQMKIRLDSASVEVEVYMVELWLCIRYSRKINYSGWWGGWVAGWLGGWVAGEAEIITISAFN